MSRKAITAGIIVSSVCLFLYILLVIAQYISYIGVFKGENTVGNFVAGLSYFQSASSWLVTIAAFFPMMLFFRCTLRWKKGAKWVILVAAVVAPRILSYIGGTIFTPFFNQTFETYEMMPGIIGLTADISFSFIASAVSAFVWAAAVYGLGLAGKAALQPAPQPNPPAVENHFNPAQDTPLD